MSGSTSCLTYAEKTRPVAVLAAFALSCLALLLATASVAADSEGAPPGEYLVQAERAAIAALEVERVGGEVIDELAIIRSVHARLTTAQHAELEDSPRVTRIWTNRHARVDAASFLMVLDRFDSASFSNQDGSDAWFSSYATAETVVRFLTSPVFATRTPIHTARL